MTVPKHTAGPWIAQLSDSDTCGYEIVQAFEGGDVVAGEYGIDSTDDARLIAAAPELYDAADNALGVLIGCCVPGDGVDDRAAILDAQRMLRAAIAKATGETP